MEGTHEQIQLHQQHRPLSPLIHVTLLGIKFTAILDSGSHVSILGNNAIHKLKSIGMVTTPMEQCLTFGEGSTNVVKEKSKMIVNFENWNTMINFLLLPSRPGNIIILGTDFLQTIDMILYIRLGGCGITIGQCGQIFYPFVKCCDMNKTCHDDDEMNYSLLQQNNDTNTTTTTPCFYPFPARTQLNHGEEHNGSQYRVVSRTESTPGQNMIHHRRVHFYEIYPQRNNIFLCPQPQPVHPIITSSNPSSQPTSNLFPPN